MSITSAPTDLVKTLNALFTRAYYSAAGYLFESDPFTHSDDDDVLTYLVEVRRQERQHSRMLAQILESLDRMPEPGAFPYWYRDLNYLTAPFMAGFVVETLETDLIMYAEALEIVPDKMGLARTMLDAIRAEKAVALEDLRPLVVEAKEREQKRYAAGVAELDKARAKRAAEAKARKEALRKAKSKSAAPAAGAGMPDPDEPGISNKEKAKRYVLRMRAIKAGGAAAAPAASGPSFEDWAASKGLLDPTESGISNREKGTRRVLMNRAKKQYEAEVASGAAGGGGGGVPSYEAWAQSEGLLDPNEDGIDNKEKGKRKVLWNRGKKKYEAAVAAGELGGGAAASAGPSFEDWAKENGVLDPEEEGIDNKERGKRKVLWNRAKKKFEAEAPAAAAPAASGGGQTFEQYAAANGVADPEEAGLDNKERGKRKVLWNRAKKAWEKEQA